MKHLSETSLEGYILTLDRMHLFLSLLLARITSLFCDVSGDSPSFQFPVTLQAAIFVVDVDPESKYIPRHMNSDGDSTDSGIKRNHFADQTDVCFKCSVYDLES